jgi:hypothetical protein
MRSAEDYARTKKLQPGDPCLFRYPARSEWLPGEVVRNGGSGFWQIRDLSAASSKIVGGCYIEHVRALTPQPLATLQLELTVLDPGERRTRITTGDPMASKEADEALMRAVDNLRESLGLQGFQTVWASYGVTARDV